MERIMFKTMCLLLAGCIVGGAMDLPVKKSLSLQAIKAMVAAAEAEAAKRNVQVTICVVDESGNLLFFEKGEGAALNTIEFAQRKAKHAAFYGSPSKDGQDSVKKGDLAVLNFPQYFPNQGGLPIKVDGQTIGGISASGARSDIDEAIAQAGLDALLKP
jgi:glc operon protein GlcG